ncbi:MAG: AI-2E family transporter [Clostridia bacterium]|nr:AI-2E family transporter [Clostridia bacterium]
MRKLKNLLDPKYTKICMYAGVTAALTAVAMLLLWLSGGVWRRLWSLFVAVLRPIVIGGIFCYLLTPPVNGFERAFTKKKAHAWARPLSVLLTLLLTAAGIILILLLVLIAMYRSVSAINLDAVSALLSSAQGDILSFLESLADRVAEIGLPVERIGNLLAAIVNGIKNAATGLLFGVIFAVYFLLDGTQIGGYWKRALRLLAGEKAENRLALLREDADRVFSGYIRGQFVDALIVGVLSSVAFLIAGVPDAIVVGVLTGLGNLIPYVGPTVGYLTLAVVCIPSAAWEKLLTGAICLAVIMSIDSNLINPRLLSSKIKIHPLLVVAALIGGGVIGGFVGMIVAVPTAALLKVQFDRYLEYRERTAAQADDLPDSDSDATE